MTEPNWNQTPLIPTSLDGLIGEFIERAPIERDKYGRFINEGISAKIAGWNGTPMGAAIPPTES